LLFKQKHNKEVQLLIRAGFINHDIALADIDQIDDSSWQTVSVPHDWAAAGPLT
jgi:hypothetical protein